MVYLFDDKKLGENDIDSVTIIHNEQKFLAWILKNLKPEYACFLECAACGRAYNAKSDEKRSWYDYSELERAYLNDVMQSFAKENNAFVEIDEHDSASGLPEFYSFAVDRHVARFASDIPESFEEANCVIPGGTYVHCWRDGRVLVYNPYDSAFSDIKDSADYDITVFTL